MSESIGKPWIESSVVDILVDHGHELPSPSKLQGRAQIVKFLTFREDRGDGKQPRDRDTVLWAEITDGEWIMPVRIANEATNQIEDEYKRALTYYRRGFFTLKAAVAFDFIVTQVGKSQTKLSPSKHLFLDIVELHYISGGGEGAPVATRAVALQAPPKFNKWVSALENGGQTLTRVQTEERTVKEITRVNSRRSNTTGASKRVPRGSIKTHAQSVTPQPSIGNLAAKREWQEGWFGKRSKFHGVDYIPRPDGFELTPDQQAKFEAVLEQVKMATATNPYDPTDLDRSSSVPDRSGAPAALRSSQHARSSQIIRPSQVISSTPIDTRLPRNKPTGSQLRSPEEVDEPDNSSSDAESNEDSDSDHITPVRSQRVPKPAGNQTNKIGHSKCHIPTPRPSDTRDEGHEEESGRAQDKARLLEADDAITDKVLSQAASLTSTSQRRGAPTVLVPDSDPPNPSQHSTKMRGSSPWDCELPSEPDVLHSPESTRRSPTKGSRRLSPTLSSPSRPNLDASFDEPMNSRPASQVTTSAKQQGSSGLGPSGSQPSAAASLPSPPPEDLNGQHLDSVMGHRADETITLTSNLPHPRDASLQRDLKNGPNEQREEAFETRPRDDKLTSKKRRLSQSQSEDTPHPRFPQELTSPANGKPITENKRRRLDDSNAATKNAPRQPTRADPTNEPIASSDTTKSKTLNNRGEVIPHDHEAWANPSWMNNAPNPKPVKPAPARTSRASDVHLDKHRRIPRPSTGLRILQHPFNYPTPILERAPSPEFPPITASQFADADEDVPFTKFKVEPPTPARLVNKPMASTSRIASMPTPKVQSTASVPGHSKKSRVSSATVGNNTRVAKGRESTVQNGGRTSEGRKQKDNRRLTLPSTSGNGLTNSEARLDDSAAHSVAQPTPRRPYLGGFRPSITVDIPQKYQLTWEKWLDVTKDAYSFWLE